MVDSFERILNGCYRGAALILAPIIFVVGLIMIPVFHEVLATIVMDLASGAMGDILLWFVHLAALGMLVALVVFCYFFVKHRGWGLFNE